MLLTKHIKRKGSSYECEHSIVKPTQRFKLAYQTFWPSSSGIKRTALMNLYFTFVLSLSITFKVVIDYGLERFQKNDKYSYQNLFLKHFITIGIVLFTCALYYL